MDKKIVEYDIAAKGSDWALGEFVRERMKYGWQPFGGGYYNPTNGTHCQVLVKYE